MSRGGSERFVRALLVVALVLGGVAVSGALVRANEPGVLKEASDPALWQPSGFADVEHALDEEGAPGRARAPDGFEDEVLSLHGKEDTRVDERARVVGFTMAGVSEEMFQAVSCELEALGWIRVESGLPNCGTFVKEEGSYRWLFVSCVQAGESTSVVVQYATTENEGS